MEFKSFDFKSIFTIIYRSGKDGFSKVQELIPGQIAVHSKKSGMYSDFGSLILELRFPNERL